MLWSLSRGKLVTMVRAIPNMLTFGRLVLTIVVLIMILWSPYVPNRPPFLDVAFVLFVIAGLTDIVDGIVARRLNVTSKFGRMVDPLFDKILICGAFVCFAIIGEPKLFGLGRGPLAAIHWSVAGILSLREVYVTTLRHIAEARGVNFSAVISGKVKMFVQSFAIGTVMIKMAHVQTAEWGYWFTTVVIIITLAVTVATGVMARRRTSWKRAVRKATR